jgi:hypothetical protein
MVAIDHGNQGFHGHPADFFGIFVNTVSALVMHAARSQTDIVPQGVVLQRENSSTTSINIS